MDVQKLLAEVQAKADANGDGKITVDDVQAFASQYGVDQQLVDGLKAKADANGDGKVGLADIKSATEQFHLDQATADAQGVLGDLKDKLFGGNDAK